MQPKNLKSVKKEFRKHGIFYTPPGLAEKLKSYVDIEPRSVYDIILQSLIQSRGIIEKCAFAV